MITPEQEKVFEDFKSSFRAMQKLVHDNAVKHGWWEGDDHNDGEKIALMHSELSEALEAHRVGNPPSEKNLPSAKQLSLPFETDVLPLTCVEEELADAIIREMDYSEHKEYDLAQAIVEKHKYNLRRPHRHGGKAF